MNDTVLAHEPYIRVGIFLGVFLLMALWEAVAPKRTLTTPKTRRWASNLGLTVLNSAALRLLVPVQAVGCALIAKQHGWGLFNTYDAPPWFAVAATMLLLDLVIYFQHRWFHRSSALWSLHRVHHLDLDIDVTTGSRFHPLEIALSMGIKMTVVVLLGAPAVGVVLFEVLLNAAAMFNHSNVRMNQGLDTALRSVIVTPDMHRVHHSVVPKEMNSNFGFNLSLWDRVFKTYCAQPLAGHLSMVIGLPGFRDPALNTLSRMLIAPFSRNNKGKAS